MSINDYCEQCGTDIKDVTTPFCGNCVSEHYADYTNQIDTLEKQLAELEAEVARLGTHNGVLQNRIKVGEKQLSEANAVIQVLAERCAVKRWDLTSEALIEWATNQVKGR